MLIIEYPNWVKQYQKQNGQYPEDYYLTAKTQNEASIDLMQSLKESAKKNKNYESYHQQINGSMNEYEFADIIGICKNRTNFDNLYETDADYMFNGGLVETKIGDDYIIYGFQRD